MKLGKKNWRSVRQAISELLRDDNPNLRDNAELRKNCIISQKQVEMLLPVSIGDYTDFYSSEEHAINVGTLFRDKNNPLLPNWKHLPVGYHGRASSIIASGTEIFRPCGQIQNGNEPPQWSPSQKLDFELEMACFIGKDSKLGDRIPLEEAEDYIFGLVLLNDWSARDIQRWEYVPLGPFVSKSFATSISPWVVSFDALEPFRVQSRDQDPTPLPYLHQEKGAKHNFDIHLEVSIATKETTPQAIVKSNAKHIYWSMPQQIAHHTVTGCNLRTGDLLATGTISGPDENSYGSLLELTWNGEKPLNLSTTETRKFLEDFDEVIMTGWCQADGYRVGFGQVSGRILPAKELS